VADQHPLAYLLGIEGIALLRAFSGAHDRAFTEARLAEVRALLDADLGTGGTAPEISTRDGYAGWAETYDAQANQLIELEQPVVRSILDDVPAGVALDAACGTGRHAAYLASLGHRVIGVDSSPDMLDRARAKVPAGEFHQADLHALPVPDDHVDVVVCALALTHVADLTPVLAEFARVLRPGGHLVLSDSRGLRGIGLPVVHGGGYLPNHDHGPGDYLRAALPLGFQVRRCEEPLRPDPLIDGRRPFPADPPAGAPPDIWALHRHCPEAVNAAFRGTPAAIVWHFTR